MNLRTWVLVLVLAGGCKKKEEATPAPAPAQAPRASPAAPIDAGAGSAAPVGALELDSDPADEQTTLGVAFDNKIPRLPALSADGHLLADYDYLGGGPMDPQPTSLVISTFPAGDPVDTIPLLTVEEGTKAEGAGSNWTTPDVRKQLHERATAAVARLRGFKSLERVTLTTSSGGEPQSTKIGALTLVPQTTDQGRLVLELRDDKAAVLHREQVEPYNDGRPCNYRPTLSNVYRYPAGSMIHIQIGFRFTEECDPGRTRWVSWSLEPAAASPVDAIRSIVQDQFNLLGVNGTEREQILTTDAAVIGTGTITSAENLKELGVVERAMDYGGHDDTFVQVALSRDGKSAWASELVSVGVLEPGSGGRDEPWRASNVLVKTAAGWRIAALAWTAPRGNAETNRQAKAGTLQTAKLAGASGDAGLRDAFARLTTEGVDDTAKARADLVAIGSAPNERTVGGALFARGWNAAWKGKVTITSSVGRVMPSGTTGWVAATIELGKTAYKVPFTVFCVFDKATDGAWSLVHIQFSV